MKKLEIERRFLVKSLDHEFVREHAKTASDIRQGYFELPNQNTSFRVRIISGDKSSITIKTKRGLSGLSRDEDNHDIGPALGESLMNICHHYLEKTRFEIGRFEINVYEEPLTGIVIIEKELDFPDEKVNLPSWILEAVEVTGNLTDLHLARLASELRGTDVELDSVYYSAATSRIPRIALVGSPASGKDGVIKELEKEMPNVHFVPEAASIVMSMLKVFPDEDRVLNRRFQRTVYRIQRIFEATSLQFAIPHKKEAMIANRGTLDNAAFFAKGLEEFSSFLRTTREMEYSRYDFVIFLDKPPKKVFEQIRKNNPARYEKTYEEVCVQHEKLQQLWSKHPGFVFIKSHGDWKEKVDQVRTELRKIMGTLGRKI